MSNFSLGFLKIKSAWQCLKFYKKLTKHLVRLAVISLESQKIVISTESFLCNAGVDIFAAKNDGLNFFQIFEK